MNKKINETKEERKKRLKRMKANKEYWKANEYYRQREIEDIILRSLGLIK